MECCYNLVLFVSYHCSCAFWRLIRTNSSLRDALYVRFGWKSDIVVVLVVALSWVRVALHQPAPGKSSERVSISRTYISGNLYIVVVETMNEVTIGEEWRHKKRATLLSYLQFYPEDTLISSCFWRCSLILAQIPLYLDTNNLRSWNDSESDCDYCCLSFGE